MVGISLVSARFRTLLAALVLIASISLLGAVSASAAPVVVIYPITSTGAIDSNAGGNLAILLANKLTELGGITVKPATPGTARAQFLDAAVALGADYYVTGFLTPIGTDSSLIIQIVSVQSGSVVFSTTGVVKTYADAIAGADSLRAAILHHAGRGFAALDAPRPTADANVATVAKGGAVDIGKALRKRKRATATSGPVAAASPSPQPSRLAVVQSSAPTVETARPERLLVPVTGERDAAVTSLLMRALVAQFAHAGRPVALASAAPGEAAGHTGAICARNPGAHEIESATMFVGHNASGAARVQIDLRAYDCAGNIVRSSHAVAAARGPRALGDAIGRAAAEAMLGLPRASR